MPHSLGVYKSRRFPVAADLVFEAWTDPRVRVPPIVSMRADVRVGGEVRIAIETGSVRSVMLGEYLEVEPGRRLRYTWQWSHRDEQTMVTVKFQPTGDSCRLTLLHEGFTKPGDREAHQLAWEAYLQQLDREVSLRAEAKCL